MSYARKRAPVACNFCRHRKRRCDGRRPVCGNCAESDADCTYQELSSFRFDGSSNSNIIQERLDRIEQLLWRHDTLFFALSERMTEHEKQVSPLGSTSNECLVFNGQSATVNGSPNSSVDDVTAGVATKDYQADILAGQTLPPFTIPMGHNTSTIRVLRLPLIKSLIGDYPQNYFFNIEAKRNISGLVSDRMFPPIDQDIGDMLVATYISTVHPHHPVVDTDVIFEYYKSILENGLCWDIKSAIVLIVLALGEIASNTDIAIPPLLSPSASTPLSVSGGSENNSGKAYPGMHYFNPAFNIISDISRFDFGLKIEVAQAQVLAGAYLAYAVHPLSSWKMIHAASCAVQMLITQKKTIGNLSEIEIRLFWSCFLIESDRLAEFELPRSGIEALVDDMPLPSVSNPPDPAMIYFLAEISIRRLLNRVHNSLYCEQDQTSRPLKSMMAICDELNRQLEMWHESIPGPVKPTLGPDALEPRNEREAILRIRYYAARHIIFRPFVLNIIAKSPAEEDYGGLYSQILDGCAKCLESIRMYLQHVSSVLQKSSSYSWTLSMSSLGAIVIATTASRIPALRDYISDIRELQEITISNLALRAEEGSSIQRGVWILKHILHKQEIWNE
ncbi:hypothetical protein V1511DRAFT_513736 [Dipodascopsis uninucleata]